jgi:hypothetical protein
MSGQSLFQVVDTVAGVTVDGHPAQARTQLGLASRSRGYQGFSSASSLTMPVAVCTT